ncbi:basic leucine zipper transcriptional factor ATF-like 2 isoform X1 [Alligator mississippiensis]|uniref:Basic leucine zipper transcriptional factor ATF-like 2 isoform B n=1 Tax=Alligator mississippiensis TaxID=8496 RepID=A0A151NYM7_ALLMI|nr:basic leucine zipper transcriptional factor ATF-like 2 isoform X1 [Alligator mississippiensis]KYO41894.1 basic leucine zipper transcriptional factor ATF-like 2 isoform B [Alligator mississippiensis]
MEGTLVAWSGSSDDSQGVVDPSDTKQQRRRQRNRVAAQRSRKKHTEKADELHQQHEQLEQANAGLRREIEGLQQEIKAWSQVLAQHEVSCVLGGRNLLLDLLAAPTPRPWALEGLELDVS